MESLKGEKDYYTSFTIIAITLLVIHLPNQYEYIFNQNAYLNANDDEFRIAYFDAAAI